MTKDQLDSFKKLKVFKLDIKKLSSEIDASVKIQIEKAGDSSFAPKIKTGDIFYVYPFGITKNNSGQYFKVDNEAVHRPIVRNLNLDIYCENEESNSIDLMPRFTNEFSIEEILTYVNGEVSMEEFMGTRFAYNSRIENNMQIFNNSMNE